MLPVGTVLRSNYRIEKQIGAGGFGNTYLVYNQGFEKLQAVKEFFMKDINLREGLDVTVSIPEKGAIFEAQRNKFKTEAQRLYVLDNPHIVKVRDFFEENGTAYYVMDYIDGLSLADTIKKGGPIDEAKAMDIFRQMLDALNVIHSQKPMMLHLDIKPSNIMLDKSGKAYLLDFGSSKQVDLDKGMTSSAFAMTPGYAPSELIDHTPNRIGPWTDLYELGATLYHILTGHQPPTISEITEYGKEAFDFLNTISKNSRELILWLMSLSRAERPKSVEEVLDQMGQFKPTPTSQPKPAFNLKPHNNDDETIGGGSDDNDDDDETVLDNENSNEFTGTINPPVCSNPNPESISSKTSSNNNNNLLFAFFGLIVIGAMLFYLFGKGDSITISKPAIDKNADPVIEIVNNEPETVVNEAISALSEQIEAQDVNKFQEVLTAVLEKKKIKKLAGNNPEMAKYYVDKIQNFLRENAYKIENFAGQNEELSTIIRALTDIPAESLVNSLSTAIETAEDATVPKKKPYNTPSDHDTRRKTSDDAKKAADEAVDAAAKKAKETLGL